ncbi:YraN family protein [Olsenella sp. An290]|uniref:YraN family protein n=1 Tax=Olsenella sp. An290 TaxID=1965625 RepID=UPI000B3795C4|nr:YraN family protein [Olsenella sp. An290]OUO34947.1 hypothetical protein B5F84_04855 [Olsenella sp. An290]
MLDTNEHERACEGEATERPREATPVSELTPRELGMRGEDIAAAYLERHGWAVLERNWRCDFGEVDIVAREDGRGSDVVLLEVKTRLALGERADVMPELAVDRAKRDRYRMLALCYVVAHPEVETVRFDVIAINVVREGGARLRHLSGAFSLDS